MSVRILRLFSARVAVMFVLAFACMTSFVFAGGYDEALGSFRNGGVSLWLNSSLPDKMSKLDDGVAVVVFEKLWRGGRVLVECDFFGREYRTRSPDDSTLSMTKAEFDGLCSEPTLVSYGGKVYLNIPNDTVAPSGLKDSVGDLIAGGMYDIARSLVAEMPRRKVRIRFVADGYPDLVFDDAPVSGAFPKSGVCESIRKMVETVTRREWQAAHAKRAKRLPQKPPVVYGKMSTIVKRADGTFEIPREPPPKSKTITWQETVYAEERGELDNGMGFSMNVPVGTIERSREKPMTQMYDYEELRDRMERYEADVEELKNDKPPVVDDAMVERVVDSGCFRFSAAK